jgi:hypothetical protein
VSEASAGIGSDDFIKKDEFVVILVELGTDTMILVGHLR